MNMIFETRNNRCDHCGIDFKNGFRLGRIDAYIVCRKCFHKEELQ